MLTCRQVAQLTSSGATAGKPDRSTLGVWLHLAMCRHCRAYTAALRRIGDMVRQPNFPGRSSDVALVDRIVVAVMRDLEPHG